MAEYDDPGLAEVYSRFSMRAEIMSVSGDRIPQIAVYYPFTNKLRFLARLPGQEGLYHAVIRDCDDQGRQLEIYIDIDVLLNIDPVLSSIP